MADASQSTVGSVSVNMTYVKSLAGIFKLVEIVLSVIVIICASVFQAFVNLGGGWILFVSVTALILTLLLHIMYVMDLIKQLPHTMPKHLMVFSVVTFISACIVSPWGGQGFVQTISLIAFMSALALFLMHIFDIIMRIPGPWQFIEFIYYLVFTIFYLIAAIIAAANGWRHSAIGACAFFAFLATGIYGVDTFFQFRSWQAVQTGSSGATTGTTVNSATTTTTQVSTVTTGNVEAGGWQQY